MQLKFWAIKSFMFQVVQTKCGSKRTRWLLSLPLAITGVRWSETRATMWEVLRCVGITFTNEQLALWNVFFALQRLRHSFANIQSGQWFLSPNRQGCFPTQPRVPFPDATYFVRPFNSKLCSLGIGVGKRHAMRVVSRVRAIHMHKYRLRETAVYNSYGILVIILA